MKDMMRVLAAVFLWLSIVVATLGAWVQHFITSVSQEMWVLMVLGAIAPPIGMLHGWLVWLGVLS